MILTTCPRRNFFVIVISPQNGKSHLSMDRGWATHPQFIIACLVTHKFPQWRIKTLFGFSQHDRLDAADFTEIYQLLHMIAEDPQNMVAGEHAQEFLEIAFQPCMEMGPGGIGHLVQPLSLFRGQVQPLAAHDYHVRSLIPQAQPGEGVLPWCRIKFNRGSTRLEIEFQRRMEG